MNWDDKFIGLAKHIATWSKDPSRKIGAVAVDDNKNVLSMGYNGFPRGIEDSYDRLNDRETKYQYVVHAEQNAIYNACRNGVSLKGATLYVTGLPICSECMKGVIQSGISCVVIDYNDVKNAPTPWDEHWDKSVAMIYESGIELKYV